MLVLMRENLPANTRPHPSDTDLVSGRQKGDGDEGDAG